jgi:hypothetical protein
MGRIRGGAVAVLLAALALAGCSSTGSAGATATAGPGASTGSGTAGTGGDGGGSGGGGGKLDLDTVDACTIIADADLTTFFGEGPGQKSPLPGGSGCAYDNHSETAYIALLVQDPAVGAKAQFDYDKHHSDHAADIAGLGDQAFGWWHKDEADVEIVHKGVLVIVSRLTYSTGADPTVEATAEIGKLVTLARAVLAKL